jgi:Flp pilus assembly protein TadG
MTETLLNNHPEGPARGTRRFRFGRFARDKRGSAAIEFAAVVVPFLGLMFAIFDTSLIFFKAEYLQSAVDSTGRLIFTGQQQATATNNAAVDGPAFKTKLCASLPVVISCGDVEIDVRVFAGGFSTANRYAPATGFDPTKTQFNPGVRGDIVVITAFHFHGLIRSPMPTNFAVESGGPYDGKTRITASAAFRNEPF